MKFKQKLKGFLFPRKVNGGLSVLELPPTLPVEPAHERSHLIGSTLDNNILPREFTDLYIAVIGMTGSGKSTFISLLCADAQTSIGHSLGSCITESCQLVQTEQLTIDPDTETVTEYVYQFSKTTRVHLLDTPGFNDNNRSDVDILGELLKHLSALRPQETTLDGILYLHPIDQVRMTGSSMKSIRILRQLCGNNYLHIVLTTTMWDRLLNQEDGRKRQEQLECNDGFWGYLCQNGSQVRQHTNSEGSARQIVELIVKREVSRNQTDLHLQNGLVDNRAAIQQTFEDAKAALERNFEKRNEEMTLSTLQSVDISKELEGMDQNYNELKKRLQREYAEQSATMKKNLEELQAKNRAMLKGKSTVKSPDEYEEHIATIQMELEALRAENRLIQQRQGKTSRAQEARESVLAKKEDVITHAQNNSKNATQSVEEFVKRTTPRKREELADKTPQHGPIQSSPSPCARSHAETLQSGIQLVPTPEGKRIQAQHTKEWATSIEAMKERSRVMEADEQLCRALEKERSQRLALETKEDEELSRAIALSLSEEYTVEHTNRLGEAEQAPSNDVDMDGILQRLQTPGATIPSEREVWELCKAAREILLSEPSLLELDGPIRIVGDIRGQHRDLLRIIKPQNSTPPTRLLFLGNYTDSTEGSIQTLCTLLAYKCRYPKSVFLLRGIRETGVMARFASGNNLYKQCCLIYKQSGPGSFSTFVRVFECLPLAAVISKTIFAVSGGLSPELKSLEDIRKIHRPMTVPERGLACDLIWSDPKENSNGWARNERGISLTFGSDVVAAFQKQHRFRLIVRSHQLVSRESRYFSNQKLMTLFSAPGYRGEFDNSGDVLLVDKNGSYYIQYLQPQDSKGSDLSQEEIKNRKKAWGTYRDEKMPSVNVVPLLSFLIGEVAKAA